MSATQAAEALTQYGSKYVSDKQLLECLGVPVNAIDALMSRANHTLAAIAKMSTNEIAEIKGIGRTKAAAIVAAVELGRRRQAETATYKEQITTSADLYAILHPQTRDLQHEEFWIVLLDRRRRVIKTLQIHIGGMSSMVVDPKIIFQRALEYKACCIILSHNHPSGSPSPSNEDIRLTEKVNIAGNYIDIKVLDHIIIGDGCYYSFADEGKM